MENWGQRKTIINLFWKISPFILIACFIVPALMYKTQDPTYWFIFLPAVVLCVFPFSVTLSFLVRMLIITKKIQPNYFKAATYAERKKQGEELLRNPQYAELARKASKWGQISMLIGIVVFLIIAAVAIHFIKIERSEPSWQIVKYPQPQALSEGSLKNELLHTLDIAIRYLFSIPFIALVLGAIIIIRSLVQRRKEKRRMTIFWKILPFLSAALFVIPILLIFILGGFMQRVVRNEVKSFLRNVSPNVTAKVNGQPARDPNMIIAELSKVAPLAAHHSHTTKRIRVEITDNNNGLVVELRRDSSRDQEYWVFYLGYGNTFVNEIGRINTNIFDDY